MGEVPVVTILGPAAIGVAALVFWLVVGRGMMAAGDRKFSEYRLGELAPRLGLQLVEGDPSLNLSQAHTKHDMARSQATGGRLARALGDREKETRIRMDGAPHGYPTRLWFHSYSKFEERIAVGFVTNSFEFRLSVMLPLSVPEFEIVRRRAGTYGLKAKAELSLPKQSFGDRELDSRLTLSSEDPRIGPYLAPAAAHLAAHKYVHIQGGGTGLHSLAEEQATMWAAFELERTYWVLLQMANALAGPARQP